MTKLFEDLKVDELWQRYKQTHDKQLRDQLVIQYAPLVKYVAARVGSGLPNHIEQSDLVSYGFIGLIDAIERFDLGRQVKFETYAMSRIKGAIIDELRATDWVPRSIRNRIKELEQAYSKLESSLRRTPTDAELAQELGVSEAELTEIFKQVSFTGIIPLDEVLFPKGSRPESSTLRDLLPDLSDGPQVMVEVQEMRRVLRQAILKLGEREKTVLALYYYEGLTLAQIGEILGVTESRVCQIHTKAILQLRVKLRSCSKDEHNGGHGYMPRDLHLAR
ncbi:MAG: RNA polymerase sigma factor WhiG [Actinobacteria bacterium]|jgi:RNA polymerase sigma factor for flagellar operon FliA|nr:RNA polymerase sigma factor WhiG [Actinomycetota bacterium]MCL6095226.1 RNA polymerase sigma factor WhiG [Actinomycetota bacterium]